MKNTVILRLNSRIQTFKDKISRNMKIWALAFCVLIMLGICILISVRSDFIEVFPYQDFLFDNDFNVQIQQARRIQVPLNLNMKQESPLNKNSNQFNIQKILWLFTDETQQQKQKYRLFKKLNTENTRRIAAYDNYTIIEINSKNYQYHLSNKSTSRLNQVFSMLEARMQTSQRSFLRSIFSPNRTQLQSHYTEIKKRLIIYSVISEKGGIFVDNTVTLVERFGSWVQNISDVPYRNNGDLLKTETKCLGFFDPDYSSRKIKSNVERDYEFEKQNIRMFPNLEDYFIACQKGSQFLGRLIQTYVQILQNQHSSHYLSILNKNSYLVGKTQPYMTYSQGHLTAIHSTLQQHQHELKFENKLNFSLAIDSFGLATISSYLGPVKLNHTIFSQRQKYYFLLSKLTIKQLQSMFGKVRFVVKLDTMIQLIEYKLRMEDTINQYIVQGSFLQRFLIHNDDKEVKKNIRSSLDFSIISHQNSKELSEIEKDETVLNSQVLNQTIPQWQSIGKHVWIIWDTGVEGKSSFFVQLCYLNLKRSAQNSGFEMHAVSKSTVNQFISKQLLQRINYAVSNANYKVSRQAVTDLWRLAFIYEHGGVYLDASTFTMDLSFDWLKNITRIPPNYLWNRYGNQPEVLMFWNAYYGGPLDWHIDQKHKIKSQWHLSYENNFIAAVKGSELIKEWLDVFMEWMTLPYELIEQQTKATGIHGHKWTSKHDQYLLAMDSLKYVVGRRQKMLETMPLNDRVFQSASDYYKIWSCPGQMVGQQKLRGQTNYENIDYRLYFQQPLINNIYKYRYSLSYAQSVLGPIAYQSKFFSNDLAWTNRIFYDLYSKTENNFTYSSFQEEIHPQSILAQKLLRLDEKKTLELLEYYTKLSQMKIKLKTGTKMWFY